MLELEFPIGNRGTIFRDSIPWDLCDPQVPTLASFASDLQEEFELDPKCIRLIISQMETQLEKYFETFGFKKNVVKFQTPESISKDKYQTILKRMRLQVKPLIPLQHGRISTTRVCHSCAVVHRVAFVCCDVEGHAYCRKMLRMRYKIEMDNTELRQCLICTFKCKCEKCRVQLQERVRSVLQVHQGEITSSHLTALTAERKPLKERKRRVEKKQQVIQEPVVLLDPLHASHTGRKQCTECARWCYLSDQFCMSCCKIFKDADINQLAEKGVVTTIDRHMPYCVRCKVTARGLLRCQLCPRAYHSSCLKEEDRVSSNWICSECSKGTVGPVYLVTESPQVILERLSQHDFALPFSEPIDSKILPIYATRIKKPMDFQTIRNKIDDYPTLEAFLIDLMQVFTNCRVYNSFNSAVVKMATTLQDLTRRMVPSSSSVVNVTYASDED